jgi:hypothetical protein
MLATPYQGVNADSPGRRKATAAPAFPQKRGVAVNAAYLPNAASPVIFCPTIKVWI